MRAVSRSRATSQGAINIAVDLVGYTVLLSNAAAGSGVPLLTGSARRPPRSAPMATLYLDITTGQLYGPKAGGTWPAPLPALSSGGDLGGR